MEKKYRDHAKDWKEKITIEEFRQKFLDHMAKTEGQLEEYTRSSDGRYYRFNRETGEFGSITNNYFTTYFLAKNGNIAEANKYWDNWLLKQEGGK